MKSRRLLAVRTAKELSGELLELSALKHSQELPQEHDAFNDGCKRAAFVFRSAAGRFSLSTQRGKGLKSRSTNQNSTQQAWWPAYAKTAWLKLGVLITRP